MKKNILKYLVTVALGVGGLWAFADNVTTPPLGNTHLHLGGGAALVDTSPTAGVYTVDGSKSSTFIENLATNAVTNIFVNFVDGQRAHIYLQNAGTNKNTTVKFTDTGLLVGVGTNDPVAAVVEVSYVDGSYRTRAQSFPTFKQLTIATNELAQWPTAAALTNQATVVSSNNVVYILTTTLNSTAWGATNKIAP